MTGVATVAGLELILRFRAGRWRWLLVSWFLGLVAFSVLLELATHSSTGYHGHRGTILFGGLQLFMLGLALFVVPALTSQSINGDREQGRLGVLQVTDITPLDIVGGKLLAAWGTACVFVLVSAPITVWAMALGGIALWQVVVVSVVMMVLLGIVCAIGLGLSAVLTRSTTSSVLTYVAVFVLTIGTLVLAGLLSAVDKSSGGGLAWQPLVANPFVILADAAPAAPMTQTCYTIVTGSGTILTPNGQATPSGSSAPRVICQSDVATGDVLGGIRQGIRDAERRTGPSGYGPSPAGPVWPYGLAVDMLVAGLLLWAAVRRLGTPRRRVPAGVRLA